jgi:hypothetical protein
MVNQPGYTRKKRSAMGADAASVSANHSRHARGYSRKAKNLRLGPMRRVLEEGRGGRGGGRENGAVRGGGR